MTRVALFVIDGQNDFCHSGNEPNDWPQPPQGQRPGALYVDGADKEAEKVASLIDALSASKLEFPDLFASLDSHHLNDGSHNTAWKDRTGDNPPPFTIVTNNDVKEHKYLPRFENAQWQGQVVPSYEWALNYTEALEKEARAPLCLWPPHCLIGTWGQSTYYPLQQAYDRWAQVSNRWVRWISKGEFPFGEHYSALRADIPDPKRPDTQMQTQIVQLAFRADVILWTGWAGSHCLAWTGTDAANEFGSGANDFLKKSVFFKDASAPVPNPPGPNAPDFGQIRLNWLAEMENRGATVTTIPEYINTL